MLEYFTIFITYLQIDSVQIHQIQGKKSLSNGCLMYTSEQEYE